MRIQPVHALALLFCPAVPLFAQPLERATSPEPAASADEEGTRRALILCGHPGDDAHRALYAQSIESLHETLVGQYGFPAGEIRVLFGAETNEEDGPALQAARGVSERERVLKEIAALRKRIRPEDTLWVVVLGHAHHDGRRSWLNLPGRDLNHQEFGAAFRGVEAREQVFFVTTAVSGFFVESLSQKGRIVVTATEPDLETNETLFHLGLVEVLQEMPGNEEYDVDDDGRLTLFDLYVSVTRNVADRYVAEELVATEHAHLDDNGDGRATELQVDYLTEAQGGRATDDSRPPVVAEGTDGWLARHTALEADPVAEDDSPDETPR